MRNARASTLNRAPAFLGALTAALAAATLATALAVAPAAAAGASPQCVPAVLNSSSVLPGSALSVSPLPGSYDASPQTQISIVGAPARALGAIRVRGSRTGTHRGRLIPYSQGDGASFVPASPFGAGETVSVSGTVSAAGARTPFSYRFLVAHEDPLPYPSAHPPAGHPASELQHFRSRPDLQPPTIAVGARSPLSAPGDIFLSPTSGPGPPGPMIFDEAGNLVWFQPLVLEATNLQVQLVYGKPLLTWWQGHVPPQGFGEGEDEVYDSSYRLRARVRAGNGFQADLHDFRLTSANTALITVFDPLSCNLAAVGGPAAGFVTDSGFQEIDLGTGLVRREWHALDHVPLANSFNTPKTASAQWPFDFFHINSLDPHGQTTLISARNTSALYELEPASGVILKTVGGKHSDLVIAPGAETAYQHDASMLPDGTISLFDNGASPKVHPQSRALVISLDGTGASLVAQYPHPVAVSSASQGSAQVLENGDVFVGWGAAPYISEFSPTGALLFDARLPGTYDSYRAYRFPWSGTPSERPAIAAPPPARGAPEVVYASWNGDTRTATWRVLGGASVHHLVPVASAPRSGFETAITLPHTQRFVAVQALDAAGNALGSSRVARTG